MGRLREWEKVTTRERNLWLALRIAPEPDMTNIKCRDRLEVEALLAWIGIAQRG